MVMVVIEEVEIVIAAETQIIITDRTTKVETTIIAVTARLKVLVKSLDIMYLIAVRARTSKHVMTL